MPDALSRLPINNEGKETEKESVLDMQLEAFMATMVEITPETRERIKQSYKKEESWRRILEVLTREDIQPKNFASGLKFGLQDGLIYYQRQNQNRLCLP